MVLCPYCGEKISVDKFDEEHKYLKCPKCKTTVNIFGTNPRNSSMGGY